MCVICTPESMPRCSIARCGTLPSPGDAKVRGDFFASATRSWTVFAGIDGCTTSACADATTCVIGAKSFTGSYWGLFTTSGNVVIVVGATRSV
jgi:hypothetical protein